MVQLKGLKECILIAQRSVCTHSLRSQDDVFTVFYKYREESFKVPCCPHCEQTSKRSETEGVGLYMSPFKAICEQFKAQILKYIFYLLSSMFPCCLLLCRCWRKEITNHQGSTMKAKSNTGWISDTQHIQSAIHVYKMPENSEKQSKETSIKCLNVQDFTLQLRK